MNSQQVGASVTMAEWTRPYLGGALGARAPPWHRGKLMGTHGDEKKPNPLMPTHGLQGY